jgi:DNA-binding MarR family transcriptional regulator
VGRAFKGTVAALRRLRGRESHRPGELSYAQYGLLFGLAESPAMSARELALSADVSPATATEMLDALAASGLVERTRSTLDKRIVLTSLTARGRALVDERRARYEPRWRSALAEFSDELGSG